MTQRLQEEPKGPQITTQGNLGSIAPRAEVGIADVAL